jgi:hypothetical protein
MSYPVNTLMLIQMIKQGQNPQQLLMSILEGSAANNPINSNLLDMVKNRKTADIETFARNYFASQGKDFDSEFKAFKETYGLR